VQKHIKLIFNILAICIIFIFSFEGLCNAGSGVLISVNGKIEIVSDGKTTIAKPGRALASGDLVKSLGGTAVLVLASGKTQMIKASKEYKLSEGTGDKKNGLGARLASALNEAKNSGKGPFVRGMVRAGEDFKLIYPSNSSILSDRLKFDWKGRENTAEAKIVVKSEDSDFIFTFNPNLDADTISWPENGPKLVPGRRYYWKVTGMNLESMQESSSELRWFRILAPSDSGELEKGLQQILSIKDIQSSDKTLMKAALFYSFQLDHEVLNLLQSFEKSRELNESEKELLAAAEKRMQGV
jgi:hypothetical protein